MNRNISSTPSYFRPRARLVSLLGEQLIRDSAVGLIELVKNSHDADATHVDIKMEMLENADKTEITVQDNGHGMTPQQVQENWLSPATGNKEVSKNLKQRTSLGRQLTGDKGVGRFAVQRLGKRVKLITRSKGYKEVELTIDWCDFENQISTLMRLELT